MKAKSPPRIRPMTCPECGYHAWGTRSWWERGLPVCPCGSTLEPDKPSDRAHVGLIGAEDVSQAAWNAICRENGWEIIRNHGQGSRKLGLGAIQAPATRAAFCVYPGCGRWIAEGAERCTAGHAQHEQVPEVAAIPF